MGSVAKVIDEYDKTAVEVSGHTDSTGGAALNQKLSEQRAKAVASFLQTQGVNSNRIFTQGFGPSQPIAGNETSNGRRANRRVEIRLLSRSS
jgi:outer membrane protein OmpA-like peptidoglycan-associated protein